MTLLFQAAENLAGVISGDISWLLVGLFLFIAAAIVIYFLKNIVVNTVLGLIAWGILTYFFHISLPFWPSLLVSAVFGLAGLGALVILGFLGIV